MQKRKDIKICYLLFEAYFPPPDCWFICWFPIAGVTPAKFENGELQGKCKDGQENSSKYNDEDSTDVVDRNAAIASIHIPISTGLKDIYFYSR